jgi:hypothetical protein
MPRMSLQLNDFSGGLNTKSSPRDIAPNQVQKADNAFLSNPGLIQATSDATSKSTTSPTMTHTKQGNGAFIFNSQYNVDTDGTATQPTQAIAYPINKGSGNSTIQFFRRNFDNTGDFSHEGTNAEIDMGVDGEVQPVYYFVDGLLYVSDKLVVSGTNSSEPKKLTYIESDRFGQSVSGWQNLPMQIETDTVFTGINEYVSGSEYSAITDAGDFQVVLSSSPTIDSQDLTNVKTSTAVNIVTTTNPDDASPDPYYDIGLTDKIIYVKSLTGAVNLDTDDLDFSTAYSSSTDFEPDMVIYINNEAMKILSVSYLDSAGTSDIARLTVQRDIYGVYGGGIEHEGNSQIKVLTSDTDVVTGGGWELGSYEFCHTFVDLQDNETLPQTPLSTKFDISEGSYFNSVGFRVKYASWTSRKNEKGVRIYTRKSGGNGRWILFLDVDYTFGTHGGIRKNLFEDYQALEDNTSTYKQVATTNLLNIVNPSLDTYESINGYSQDEEDITFGTDGGYKAATVCARRAWVANVRKNDKVYDDRIYYTPVNRFSTFPDSYYLDIGISDGDSFTALHSLGNRLLAFKQRKLYVINISSSSDAGWYLEAEYDGVGCRQQESVCKTPFGVCWVNDDGVYIYDGQGLPKELSVALDDATWRTNQINKNPAIGYNNKYKQLNVVQDTAADTDVFVFDFPTQGWSLTKSIGNSGISNFLPSFDGLYYIEYGATNAKTVNLLTGDVGTKSIDLKTKDLDFGNPGLVKRVKKIFVTAKGSGTTLTLKYANDGETTFATATDANPVVSLGTDYVIKEFTVGDGANPSTDKNCESMAFELISNGSITINDINIDYRQTNKRPS